MRRSTPWQPGNGSLSSAESEYHGMVRCASEAIGLANAVRELGHEAHVRIWTAAAAARAGPPEWEQMDAKYFWLQQKETHQEVRIEKIRGTVKIPST